jgi:hypothetical protein
MKKKILIIVLLCAQFSSCYNASQNSSSSNTTTSTIDTGNTTKHDVFENITFSTIDQKIANFHNPEITVKNDFAFLSYMADGSLYAMLYENNTWSNPQIISYYNGYSTGAQQISVMNNNKKGAILYADSGSQYDYFNVYYLDKLSVLHTFKINGYVSFKTYFNKRTPSILVDDNNIVYVAYRINRSDGTHCAAVSMFNENGLIGTYEFSSDATTGYLPEYVYLDKNNNNEIMIFMWNYKYVTDGYLGVFNSGSSIYKNGSWSNISLAPQPIGAFQSSTLKFHDDNTADLIVCNSNIEHYHYDGASWTKKYPISNTPSPMDGHAAFNNNRIMVCYSNAGDQLLHYTYNISNTWGEDTLFPTPINNSTNPPSYCIGECPNILCYKDYFITLYNGIYANYFKNSWSDAKFLENSNQLFCGDDYAANINSNGELFIVGYINIPSLSNLYFLKYKINLDN